ncbi:Sulfotransferase domain protein [Candidatus Methylomirabilis lanthanidiphila]|uniref:Sulfotransferase domain protein n=1 Tax=Candidatus Methylomirabilis lanthanidiphila TaxID=2211376 RepID=A0A564ZHV0_9BACT|nr:sulfotransferase [Candidatus Methylomirabilis lanthanidiphila]VUZ84865.1 Sulfotransferase domain protein [Candidatus Methylomirabilis lanthanidiphila]
MIAQIKRAIASTTNIHLAGNRPNVFIFSTPRSGSTWLMELILTQPGFKPCNEPFNLWDPDVSQCLARLDITDWADLHTLHGHHAMHTYIQGFCDGRLRFKNPFFYRNYFRLMTHRIVFKILHAGEERINWFRDTFNGRIVFLLRHPIAVSVSRKFYPRLDAFLNTEYSEHFSERQLREARKIIDSGTRLEQGVLDWCLQNAVPLRDATPDWIIISYEQLIIDPRPVLKVLASRLELPIPERMVQRLTIPSASTHKCDEKTKQVLKNRKENNRWVLEKWREKVTEEEERRAMEILEQFNVDLYRFGDPACKLVVS